VTGCDFSKARVMKTTMETRNGNQYPGHPLNVVPKMYNGIVLPKAKPRIKVEKKKYSVFLLYTQKKNE